VEGNFTSHKNSENKYRMVLSVELVSPTFLNVRGEHALSFLFGTDKETEIVKCGWHNSNINKSG
jgi:hypothetical protein